MLQPGGRLILNVAALRRRSAATTPCWRRGAALQQDRCCAGRLEAAGFRITAEHLHQSLDPADDRRGPAEAAPARPQESQNEITVPAAPINVALSGLLAIEGALLKVMDMPLGSSLLAVAEKPR